MDKAGADREVPEFRLHGIPGGSEVGDAEKLGVGSPAERAHGAVGEAGDAPGTVVGADGDGVVINFVRRWEADEPCNGAGLRRVAIGVIADDQLHEPAAPEGLGGDDGSGTDIGRKDGLGRAARLCWAEGKDIHAVGCNTGDGHGGVVAEEHFAHSEAIHGRDAAIVRAAPN